MTVYSALLRRQRVESEGDAEATSIALPLAALTAALAPAYVLRWHMGPFPSTVLEAAILATVAAFVIERGGDLRSVVWRVPVTVPTALFLTAGAISVVVAPSRVAALGLYRAYLVEPILFAIVLLTVLRSPARVHGVVAGLWAGGAVLAAANLAAILAAIVGHRYSPSATPPVAVYLVNNAVALYLVPLIAVAGATALHERSRMIRIAAIAFLAVATPAVVAGLSRGGWVALAVVAVGLALSHRRRLPLLAGTATTIAALALVPAIRERAALELHNGAGEELSGRVRLWSASLDMLRHHPVFGTGLGGFVHAMGAKLPAFQIKPIYPHNLVLNFWSETGVLGLLAFVSILVATVVVSWRAWRGGAEEWRPLQLGVSLALLAVVVHSLVDVPYFKNDLSMEFWVLVAIAWAGWRTRRGQSQWSGQAQPAAAHQESVPEH